MPDDILFKEGKLTDEQWVIMKNHPEIGYHMLTGIPFLQGALPVVRHHHERWDGSGYPMGLRGDDIPMGARIFAIADVFDALTTQRPYKPAFTVEVALALADARWRLDDDRPAVVAMVQSFREDAPGELRARIDAWLSAHPTARAQGSSAQ